MQTKLIIEQHFHGCFGIDFNKASVDDVLYLSKEILKYKNKIEVRISQDGKTEINGMGDFSSINKNFCLQLGKDNVK